MKVNLFGSNNISHSRHNSGGLLDQFPKKRSLQRYISVLSGLALGAASSLSFGLGLGEIEPKSFLGQPLAANISLVSLDGDIDLETLIVRQVTAAEAQKMGVDIFYSGYKFDLKIDKSSGQPKINVFSKNSIDEPYLNILVELRWPRGVVYREYPLLLDPPPVVPVSNLEAKSASNKQQAVQTKPVPKKPVAAQASRPSSTGSQAKPKNESVKVGKGDAYKVQSGDTLWSIAARLREGTNLSINETMTWLHENNPQAFAGGDINKLKAGTRLKMPDLSKLKLEDGLLVAPVRGGVDTEASAPLEPVSAKNSKKELEVEETKSVIDQANRPEQGLLVVSSDLQDDRSRELIDMLTRENEDLKERMKKVENSEYLNTLKQLVSLQRRQISELKTRLGVPDDASEEMSALLSEADVDVDGGVKAPSSTEAENELSAIDENLNDKAVADVVSPAADDSLEKAPAEITEEESVVELAPVLSNPPEVKTDKSLVTWLVLGAGAFLAMIFAFLLIYYRRMIPAKTRNDYEDEGSQFNTNHAFSGHFDRSSESEELTRVPTGRSLDIRYDGDGLAGYTVEEDTDWLGEKVEDIEAFDAGAFDTAIQEVEDIFDSIALDENDSPRNSDGILEGLTQELPDELPDDLITELSSGTSLDDEFLDSLVTVKPSPKERRADHEVLSSIAAKMSQYDPRETNKKTPARMEIEDNGADELDELDEVDATISRAKMFCEFSQFDRARELIEKCMVSNRDERYLGMLDSISREQKKAQVSQEAANDSNDDVTQIEGFTTSLDDEDESVGTYSEAHVDEPTVIEDLGDDANGDKTEIFSAEFEKETATTLDIEDLDDNFFDDVLDDKTDESRDDKTEVLSELSDEDNVAGSLLEGALSAKFSEQEMIYQSDESLDLDLDIDIDFNDVDLEYDIQIDDLDDDILDGKKKAS